MKKILAGFGLVVASFSLAAVANAQGETKPASASQPKAEGHAAQTAAFKQADADYKQARAKCNELKGNEKDVCVAEARAARTRARTDAEVAANDTSSARRKAYVEMADAQYAVAKAKCGAEKGDAKAACVKKAKLERAAAKMEPSTQDKSGAMMEPKAQDNVSTTRAGSRAER